MQPPVASEKCGYLVYCVGLWLDYIPEVENLHSASALYWDSTSRPSFAIRLHKFLYAFPILFSAKQLSCVNEIRDTVLFSVTRFMIGFVDILIFIVCFETHISAYCSIYR